MAKSAQSVRCNYWATVVYPESAHENWVTILEECVVPALVSPLHDKDCNPFGEIKKEHYHVLLLFDSLKSAAQANEIFDQIGGVGCQRVNSIRGYARYLCHMDNPEKYRYPESDVRQFCGVDYYSIISLPTDRLVILMEMQDWCDDNGVFGFASLVRYARKERPDWYRVLAESGTIFMKEYLKSCSWENKPALDSIDKNSVLGLLLS